MPSAARPCSARVDAPAPAACAWLASRSSWLSKGSEQQEGKAEREARQCERRDGHVAEPPDPFRRAAPRRREKADLRLLDDAVLDQQVVDRAARTNQGERQQVARPPPI